MRSRTSYAYAIVKGSKEQAIRAAKQQLVQVLELETLHELEQKLICPISEYQRLQEWYLAGSAQSAPYPAGTLLTFTAE